MISEEIWREEARRLTEQQLHQTKPKGNKQLKSFQLCKSPVEALPSLLVVMNVSSLLCAIIKPDIRVHKVLPFAAIPFN